MSDYVMECYGCGRTGTNDDFGLGHRRQCPDCGSYEVHGSGHWNVLTGPAPFFTTGREQCFCSRGHDHTG